MKNVQVFKPASQEPREKKSRLRHRTAENAAHHLLQASQILECESARLLCGFHSRRLRRVAEGIRDLAGAVDAIGRRTVAQGGDE